MSCREISVFQTTLLITDVPLSIRVSDAHSEEQEEIVEAVVCEAFNDGRGRYDKTDNILQ